MPTSLCFNDVTFTPIDRNKQIWIRSTELARALGYSDEKAVNKIFARNADEFSPEMSQLIDIAEGANLTPVKFRVFSPRGCHLIAMFARTPVAKAFRKWVLDVLDKLTVQVALPVAKAKKPAQKALPKQKELPAAELSLEEDIELFAEEVRQAHAQTYAAQTHLTKRISALMARVGIHHSMGAHPFYEPRIGIFAANLVPYLITRCQNALLIFDDHLSKYSNPATDIRHYAGLDWI